MWPTREWESSFFTAIGDKINKHLDLFAERSTKTLGHDPKLYKLENGFMEQDRHWIGHCWKGGITTNVIERLKLGIGKRAACGTR